ncbi:hypothetical protein OQA88_1429 [Cercophora sp. LCS_1]
MGKGEEGELAAASASRVGWAGVVEGLKQLSVAGQELLVDIPVAWGQDQAIELSSGPEKPLMDPLAAGIRVVEVLAGVLGSGLASERLGRLAASLKHSAKVLALAHLQTAEVLGSFAWLRERPMKPVVHTAEGLGRLFARLAELTWRMSLGLTVNTLAVEGLLMSEVPKLLTIPGPVLGTDAARQVQWVLALVAESGEQESLGLVAYIQAADHLAQRMFVMREPGEPVVLAEENQLAVLAEGVQFAEGIGKLENSVSAADVAAEHHIQPLPVMDRPDSYPGSGLPEDIQALGHVLEAGLGLALEKTKELGQKQDDPAVEWGNQPWFVLLCLLGHELLGPGTVVHDCVEVVALHCMAVAADVELEYTKLECTLRELRQQAFQPFGHQWPLTQAERLAEKTDMLGPSLANSVEELVVDNPEKQTEAARLGTEPDMPQELETSQAEQCLQCLQPSMTEDGPAWAAHRGHSGPDSDWSDFAGQTGTAAELQGSLVLQDRHSTAASAPWPYLMKSWSRELEGAMPVPTHMVHFAPGLEAVEVEVDMQQSLDEEEAEEVVDIDLGTARNCPVRIPGLDVEFHIAEFAEDKKRTAANMALAVVPGVLDVLVVQTAPIVDMRINYLAKKR